MNEYTIAILVTAFMTGFVISAGQHLLNEKAQSRKVQDSVLRINHTLETRSTVSTRNYDVEETETTKK